MTFLKIFLGSLDMYNNDSRKNKKKKQYTVDTLREKFRGEAKYCRATRQEDNSFMEHLDEAAVIAAVGPLNSYLQRHTNKKDDKQLRKSQTYLTKLEADHPEVYQQVQDILEHGAAPRPSSDEEVESEENEEQQNGSLAEEEEDYQEEEEEPPNRGGGGDDDSYAEYYDNNKGGGVMSLDEAASFTPRE